MEGGKKYYERTRESAHIGSLLYSDKNIKILESLANLV